MQKKSFLFSVFLLGLTCAAFAAEQGLQQVLDFANVEQLGIPETIPPLKTGLRVEKRSEGWNLECKKHTEGNQPVSLVETLPGQLLLSDWSSFAYILIEVKNHSPEISPTIYTIITDSEGRRTSSPTWLRAGISSKFLIRLDSLTGLDLRQIKKIGFSINKPATDLNFTLQSVQICGSSQALPENRLVPKVFDVVAEIADNSAGLSMTGELKLQNVADGIITNVSAFKPGHDKWPGITLFSRMGGSLHNGDLSSKTHIVVELEHVFGDCSGGIRFRDDDEKEFWQAFSLSDSNKKFELDRSFVDMGLDLNNIRYASMSLTRPVYDNCVKLKAYRFEFRPETLYEPALRQLNGLGETGLTNDEKAEIKGLLAELKQSYGKVQGDLAPYNEIQRFRRLVEEAKLKSSKLMRIAQMRAAEAETGASLPYSVAVADSMTSVFLENKGFVMQPATKHKLELARREYESFQTVVFSNKQDLKNVNVSVSYLSGPGKIMLKPETSLVAHVNTVRPSYQVEYVGWYPNFIATNRSLCDIKKGETVAFWVRLYAPEDTKPGLYKGQVTVSAENVPPYTFPLEANVFNFSIPTYAPLPQSWNFDTRTMAKIYNIPWGRDNEEVEDLMDKFTEQTAEYFITYDRLYWGPYGKFNKEKDRIIKRWKSLADKNQLTAFCICNPTPMGGTPSSPEDESVQKVIDHLKVFLDDRIPALREAGILDKAYLYAFDEWRVDAVSDRVFSFVKKNWPYLKIMTTAGFNHDPDLPGLQYIDALVPGLLPAKDPELTAELRKRGKEVWWYICNFPRPPEPSFMLEVPAIVPRLFCGFMAQKYKPDGFLYWAVTAWGQWANKKNGPVMINGVRSNWDARTYRTDNEEGNFFCPRRKSRLLSHYQSRKSA